MLTQREMELKIWSHVAAGLSSTADDELGQWANIDIDEMPTEEYARFTRARAKVQKILWKKARGE